MFRRTFLRRYADYGGVSGDKGLMTLQQACTIFGFEMNEEWKKDEIKKRFKKLALKYHPDNGGTNDQFLALKEAEKILSAHRHDKGVEKAKTKGEVNFKRMNYDDLTGTIHRQTSDRAEYRSFGLADFAIFFGILSFFFIYYFYNAYKTQQAVIKSRWSYTSDDVVRGHRDDEKNGWHPWRTDYETKESMDDIGIIQGNVRKEVVEERRSQAPRIHTPWQSGGPFSRGSVPQKYD